MTVSEYIKKVEYNREKFSIYSKDDPTSMICIVLGWSRISPLFNMHDGPKFMNKLGQFITDAINEKIEREKLNDK